MSLDEGKCKIDLSECDTTNDFSTQIYAMRRMDEHVRIGDFLFELNTLRSINSTDSIEYGCIYNNNTRIDLRLSKLDGKTLSFSINKRDNEDFQVYLREKHDIKYCYALMKMLVNHNRNYSDLNLSLNDYLNMSIKNGKTIPMEFDCQKFRFNLSKFDKDKILYKHEDDIEWPFTCNLQIILDTDISEQRECLYWNMKVILTKNRNTKDNERSIATEFQFKHFGNVSCSISLFKDFLDKQEQLNNITKYKEEI